LNAKAAAPKAPVEFDTVAFSAIQQKKHTEQAIWFLNGFWDDLSANDSKAPEDIWTFCHKFIELQYGKAKYYGAKSKKQLELEEKQEPEGCSLDQFQSQRFLESNGETKTAAQLRKDLATIDLDSNGRMSLTEYLVFKFSKTPGAVVDAPQGGNQSELAAAEVQVAEARAQLDALNEEYEAAKGADEAMRAAEAEVKAAIDELEAAQEAQRQLLAALEEKANSATLGPVQRNKAKNEIDQLKAKDPMPIQRAKISQTAALKKCAKATKEAAAAAAKVEASVRASEVKMAELNATFEALKKQGGTPHGKIWWMEREFAEVKKFSRSR